MCFTKRPEYVLELASGSLILGKQTLITGVLNVTPDSFSDGGTFYDPSKAIDQAQRMVEEGADILDIGGESTRPFSDPVPVDEEIKRVVPIIEELAKSITVPISIDTCKAEVARRALDSGASIINDVSAFRFDPEMAGVAAEHDVPVVLMHMLGTPKTMQQNPQYAAVVGEIVSFLERRIRYAVEYGVKREKIIIDPGIGFGKNVTHNLLILQNLHAFHILNCPLLIGASRKMFIGKVLGKENPLDREVGTGAVTCASVLGGAHIIRVHNVAHNVEVARMADAILNATDKEAN